MPPQVSFFSSAQQQQSKKEKTMLPQIEKTDRDGRIPHKQPSRRILLLTKTLSSSTKPPVSKKHEGAF
jgi:hypothetical protein